MMHYPHLAALIADRHRTLAKGPVGLILVEDDVEVESTIRHHLKIGFHKLVVFCSPEMAFGADFGEQVDRVDFDVLADDALTTIINTVIEAAHGIWLYYCYNSEYLFYPFCEHRTVGEMIAFTMEERRDAVMTYVVDLYAGDLTAHPDAVSLNDAQMDRSGYYALARQSADGTAAERQIDVFGGLRWRFEEHVPFERRRIDRIALFRAQVGLRLNADRTFNDPEYNTFACPWHHNVTAAVCSFRTAKALRRNPGSRAQINSFLWHNSEPFVWQSKQLLDLGLIEPGQWF